jgi:hypothetical protein
VHNTGLGERERERERERAKRERESEERERERERGGKRGQCLRDSKSIKLKGERAVVVVVLSGSRKHTTRWWSSEWVEHTQQQDQTLPPS